MKTILTAMIIFWLILAYPALASLTMEDAVEISKNATEVKELLKEHPEAFAIARNDTYGIEAEASPCWEVDWWTKERVKSKLHYPNVRVWIDMETGDILNAGIPRGDNKIYPVPVSTPIHNYIMHGLWWMIGIAIIIAALIASISVMSKRKRR